MGQPKPTTADANQAYGIRLAVMAVSGALYTLAALWCAQGIGEATFSSRLLADPIGDGIEAFIFLGITVLPLTFLAAWILVKTTAGRFGTTKGLTWRWTVGLFGLWITSLFLGDIGVIIFLLYWAAFAWIVTPKRWSPALARTKTKTKPSVYPLPNDPKPQPSRRRHSRGGTIGNHGRIPKETEVLLKELVRQVTGTIVNGLPGDAPPAVRRATVRIVLEAVLQTWWDDQRVDPLDTIDVDRLKSAILLATDLADSRFDAEGQAIYRGVLRGLMGGWRLRRL
jgi:hypothetical protein